MSEAHDYFLNQTADVATAPIKRQVLDVALFCWGVFDGAEALVQVSPSALTEDPEDMIWFDHPSGIFTDAGAIEVRFWNNADFAEVYLRGVLRNAGGSTNVNLVMRPRVEFAI